MKRALIDASSAILLYKAELFHEMAGTYHLSMVPTVYREVTVRHHKGVDAFHRAKQLGKIQVLQPNPPKTSDKALRSLDAGEAETIWAYDHRKIHFIIMDDGKGARACRTKKIPYINALLCPNLLFWSRKIDAEKRTQAFQHLQRIGRYANDIVNFAENTKEQGMGPFLP